MRKRLLSVCSAVCGMTFMAGLAFLPATVTAESTAPEITPLVHYEFNDADNLGKDSMGRFDLATYEAAESGVEAKTDDGLGGYVAFDKDSSGVLYAPNIAEVNHDFANLIKGSYSVELTFRKPDASEGVAGQYILATNRWGEAFKVFTSWGKLRLTVGNADNSNNQDVVVGDISDSTWTTLLVSANNETGDVAFYINGVYQTTVSLAAGKVAFTNDTTYSNYAFALGAAMQKGCTGNENHATVDIADCKVFDYALSAENASALYAGNASAYTTVSTYVESLPALGVSGVVTNTNTQETIEAALPTTVDMNLSDGTTANTSVVWRNDGNSYFGYVQAGAAGVANPKQLHYTVDYYSYACSIAYNAEQASLVDVKLDGTAYTNGALIDGDTHTLTFKVAAASGYEVDYVSYSGAIVPAVDGTYEITFAEGAEVTVVTRKAYAYRASLSLQGDVAMNFFMQFADDVIATDGAKIIFTFKDEATELALTDGIATTENGEACYKFSYGVAAKDYDKPVQITVSVPGRETAVYEYSISSYAEALLAMTDESYASAKLLVKELLNYCKAAKAYFYQTGEAVELTKAVSVDDLLQYKAVGEGASEKVSNLNALLSLNSTTTIRVSFKATEPVTVKVDGVEITDVVDNGDGTYSFEIENIVARDLNKAYVIEVDTVSIKYSAMSYVYTVLNTFNEADHAALFTVVKAAYLYNAQADVYFGE